MQEDEDIESILHVDKHDPKYKAHQVYDPTILEEDRRRNEATQEQLITDIKNKIETEGGDAVEASELTVEKVMKLKQETDENISKQLHNKTDLERVKQLRKQNGID
ncbi:MAG: hypothetical protein EHM20_16755 [Alphaproteobacteria bacterium]|nr:MAG: hypothetical protein EHM20_16755 [Alphaproteobacteria bacterium]